MSATDTFIQQLKKELREEMMPELEQMVRAEFRNSLPNFRLTMDEAAEYLGVSTQTLSTMVKQKKIKFYRVRSRVFFRKGSLDDWIDEQESLNYVPEEGVS